MRVSDHDNAVAREEGIFEKLAQQEPVRHVLDECRRAALHIEAHCVADLRGKTGSQSCHVPRFSRVVDTSEDWKQSHKTDKETCPSLSQGPD